MVALALNKNPAARYGSVAEMGQALSGVAA
jgi:hypothetical protein